MNAIKIFLVSIALLSIYFWVSCNRSNSIIPSIGDQPVYPPIDAYPAWSPNEKWIIYNHYGITRIDVGGSYHVNPDSAGLWMINADGTNPHLILKGDDVNADWSPDGQWIVFEVGAQIYKAPIVADTVDASKIEQLTFQGRNFFPAWSPDGQWIAYDRSLADSSGSGGIWAMKNDGTMRCSLFGGAFPSWHPNGSILIGVIGTSPTSIWTRFVRYNFNQSMPLDTLQAVVGNDNSYPKYSPDGVKIIFESNTNIWVMSADGTNPKQLTFNSGLQPSWSPDGQKIVYIGFTHKKYDPQNNGTLWVMNADGSNKHQLTYGPK